MSESNYSTYVQTEWRLFTSDSERAQRSVNAVAHLKLQRVIDIGCGAGQEMLPFLTSGNAIGVGIDIDPEAGLAGRELFARHAPKARVFFLRASAEALPFETESFELAICRIALAYMNNRAALKEISRVLRPNGMFLLKIIHARYYLREGWRGLLSGDIRKVIYAVRVLLAGAIYHLSGRQPTKLANGEIFQTRWMLRRELAKCGLKDTGQTPEEDKVTPSFVIIKVAEDI